MSSIEIMHFYTCYKIIGLFLFGLLKKTLYGFSAEGVMRGREILQKYCFIAPQKPAWSEVFLEIINLSHSA